MKLATTELDQTIVMVTHDPVATSYSDRVIFRRWQSCWRNNQPTADSVIDQMRTFGT